MRDTLVILNYQREIPPFMQSVIHYADDIFSRIIYITPELYNDNRVDCRAEHLNVIQIPRSAWRQKLAVSPINLFDRELWQQAMVAKRHGGDFRELPKLWLKDYVCGGLLTDAVYRWVEEGKINPQETTLLAVWFSVEAYGMARVKARYPEFKTVSYAHSFEIDKNKGQNCVFCHNKVKHQNCDKIAFISSVMRENYFRDIRNIYPDITMQNTQIVYLGSEKMFPEICGPSTAGGTLQLLSCSGAVNVKRIHLIIEALHCVKDTRIHWTHLGGGPLLKELQQLAEQTLGSQPNITYEFAGQLKNSEVQKYYTENSVDIFVNVSSAEGLPVSLMECMSYGVPAIATDVGGSREIVQEKTGFLLPPDFVPQQLADILEAYAHMPQENRKAMRQSARDLWQERFDAKKNAVRFLSELIK